MSITRRATFLTPLLAVLPIAARAASEASYTQAAFTAAQQAGKPILVAVHASWCPTCAKQKPIIDSLAAAPENRELVILIVDFDAQKDIVKAFDVRMQSTLIAFHGTGERARSVGVTDPAAIKDLVARTRA